MQALSGQYLPFVLFLTAVVLASILSRKLTIGGALSGAAIAAVIFCGTGYPGVIMLAAFFLLGTAATVWGKKKKLLIKTQQDRSLKRNAGQVLANGGVAGLAAILVYLFPENSAIFLLMMASALSSAMADTLSSELGMIYGRRFYDIISWKAEARGLDGVVSLEGTLIGVAGSGIIALVYAVSFRWNMDFIIIIAAGTGGNLADSVLGAMWERKQLLSNDTVNFLNTFIAAAIAGLCALAY